MSLIELFNEDMKKAMKERNKRELAVIRMVKAGVKLEEINKQKEVTDDDVMDVVLKQIKLRNDAINEFKKASREELIEETQKEIDILNKYLPTQLSLEEVEAIIDEIITKNNFVSNADMGKIMKEIMPKIKGKFDIAKVNQLIKSKLS